ncbi:MAG: ABC transporter substrate-binding protein [Pikeienuella sp.]|uniref:ABC transporter substrate-binding protein n=1 Tax=Pikeienuella sp. TaxID=2831957 RepID=UPI00391DE922
MRPNYSWPALLAGALALSAGAAGAETLTVRMNADIRGTDGINRDANTDTVLHHIFETLVAFRDDLSIGPLLAESWTVSDDGRVYTFTLREGATFHNGEPVTSADVKWNWDRRMMADSGWFCIPFFDGAQGLKVEAVETPDPRTVIFRINEPNALFLRQLANIQCNGWIASPANANPDGTWNAEAAIGSGPFTLEAWEKGQAVRLARFEGYRALSEPASGYAGDRTAKVDGVTFLIVPDSATAEAALEAGQIDILPGIAPDRIEEFRGKGLTVTSVPGLSFTPLLIQTLDPLLSDPRMRRAIAHAIDFSEIADVRSAGQAQFNPSAVAQASAYFDEDFLAWPEYDPAKARALAAEAGYAGQPIKLQTNTRYQGMYENSVLAQAMLAAAGFNVELEVLDWAAQLDNYLAGTFQMQSFGYSARLDPAQMYGVLIGDKTKTPTRQWQNDAAYQLYIESTKETDFAKRQALFKEIHKLMAEDVPILGVYYEPVVDAVRPGIEGYAVWPADKTRAWGVSRN